MERLTEYGKTSHENKICCTANCRAAKKGLNYED